MLTVYGINELYGFWRSQMVIAVQSMPKEQRIRNSLNELLQVLEQVESVISVSVAALRHQNCDGDLDVARVLQRGAGDRISVQVEKIETLLVALLTPSRPKK
jgi:UDP-N-acetylmuramate-alanine ligase